MNKQRRLSSLYWRSGVAHREKHCSLEACQNIDQVLVDQNDRAKTGMSKHTFRHVKSIVGGCWSKNSHVKRLVESLRASLGWIKMLYQLAPAQLIYGRAMLSVF